MRRWLATLLSLGFGCGGDVVREYSAPDADAPQYDERCGIAGPVQLLDLAPREHAFRLDWSPDGERLLVGVFRARGPLGLFPDSSDRVIVSVGGCGEDPRLVGEAMEVVEDYAGVALACAVDGSALFRIDPTGTAPPVRILDGTCAVRRTDAGLVAVLDSGDGAGRLVIVRQPDVLAPAVETLVEGVGLPDNLFFGGDDHRTTPLWAKGSEAIAMTPGGEVILVDLDEATTEVIVDGALEFRASSDGSKIVWQAAEPLEGDADAPISAIFLHDRESGSGIQLLDSHLAWTAAPFRRQWVVVRDNSVLGQRVFDRTGAELQLPEGTSLRGIIDDERFWLVTSPGALTEELLWQPGGTPQLIMEHRSGHPAKSGEGIKVFLDDEHPADLEGALWYGAFAGGETEVLSERVNFHHRVLADGRIIGIIDEGSNAHGQLLLENPADGTVVQVDPHGYLHTPSLNAGDPFDGDIVYAVDDPDDERHALFRAAVR